MDFTFSDEQEMLRSSVRERMVASYPIERSAVLADGEGFDRASWSEAADAGWTGISVPEAEGGAGLSFVEEQLVAEELGRALYAGPFLADVVQALPALRATGARDLATAVASGHLIATLAWAGPDGRWALDPAPAAIAEMGLLSCSRLFVPNLDVADLVLVAGGTDDGPGLWAVVRDGPGVRWSTLPTVDATRRQAELVLEGAPATPLAAGGEARRLLEHLRDRTLAALAAEACGVAAAALDLGVAYAKERRQFGRPVGSFQAVSHALAHVYLELETARSLAYWAGWAVAEGAPEAGAASAAAKARAAEAAVDACERAIQAHGGVGFTWEHPLHRYYKRALAIEAAFEGPDRLWARVADAVLAAAGS